VRFCPTIDITVWLLLPLRVDVLRRSRVVFVPALRVRVELEFLSCVELEVVCLLRLSLFRFPVVLLHLLSTMAR
jgi:hypothetical protein